MAQLTIAQAAKQWGVSRGKIYSHIKKGSISASKNGEGKTVIDVSEMLRVLGDAQPKTEQKAPQQAPTLLVDSLQKQIELLERELGDAKEREKLANERNREMNDQVASLLNRLNHFEQEDKTEKKQKKKGLLGRVVDAILED